MGPLASSGRFLSQPSQVLGAVFLAAVSLGAWGAAWRTEPDAIIDSSIAVAAAEPEARSHVVDLTRLIGAWTAGPADGVLVFDGVRGALLIPQGGCAADARVGAWRIDHDVVTAFGRPMQLVRGATQADDRLIALNPDDRGPVWQPIGLTPPSMARHAH